MDEIEKQIEVVLEMLISDVAWKYQRHKSHTEEKSIDSFVARNVALGKSKGFIKNKLETL